MSLQEKDVFQDNTNDELNALKQQLSKAIEERDRLKKALEGGTIIMLYINGSEVLKAHSVVCRVHLSLVYVFSQ